MATSSHLKMNRRSLLAMAGAGLASATLPGRLFAQSGRNILVIASGQDIPNFDPPHRHWLFRILLYAQCV
ncbi:hypothetical protein [Leisingera thetidis]|uniref:hypothetical protein n=1 Tax=Leisingera thetidis TaxID=2930199 RepID=UPI0033137831